MKRTAVLMALLCAGFAQAQTAYRWVDANGKVHYGDRPPPAVAGKTQELKLKAPAADTELPYAVRQAIKDFPVTLFVSADCGAACKEGADFLRKRGIPFSEKRVVSKEDAESLSKLAGAAAMVPLLQVGSRIRSGFEASGWASLLDAAGYPRGTR